jgi:hypothetical protein
MPKAYDNYSSNYQLRTLDSWNLNPARYNRAVQAFVEPILGSSAA